MEPNEAIRQVDELINLQDQWFAKDALEIKTPVLFSRLQKVTGSITISSSSSSNNNNNHTMTTTTTLSVKKRLMFDINCSILHPEELADLTLEVEFPLNYPSGSTCQVRAVKTSNRDEEYLDCTTAISKYLDTFCGCECVEMLLDWIADNKSTCLLRSSSSSSSSSIKDDDDDGGGGTATMVPCYILRYNHLLSGPEHKKERAMISAAKKSKLQGGLLWGTPGVVLVVPPSTEDDAKDFSIECRTIGKRADGPTLQLMPQSGLDEAGIGGLAQKKRGDKLQELDTAGLRCSCGGDETLLKEILGVN